MPSPLPTRRVVLETLLRTGTPLSLATKHYPSRGKTAVQELYLTTIGKLFLKRVSQRNLDECQVKLADGGLAEREYWASRLAAYVRLPVPSLRLLDRHTTVQRWLDIPDAHQYSAHRGSLQLRPDNVFDCGLFDWLTGQIDRHDANYLYDFVHHVIILIDSGHAFLRHDGSLPDYLRFFEVAAPAMLDRTCTTPVAQRLRRLTPSKLHQLVPLRNAMEKAALVRRLQQAQQIVTIRDLLHLYRG